MLLRNNFDGGTNNTGLTSGNTGGVSGNAFTAVEAAAVFSNEQARSGTLSAKLPSTAVSGYGRWATTGRDIAVRMYVYMTADHTGDYNFIQGRLDTNNATTFATVRLTGASMLRLNIGATATNPWTATEKFPLNQWVRVEALFRQGVANNDGQARVAYYNADSGTPIQDSGWLTGLNLRGDVGAAGQTFVGKLSAPAYGGSFYMDSVAVNTDTDYAGFIGADIVALPAPTVTVGLVKNPTTPVATDGEITISWGAVAGAARYEVAIEDGTITSGFVAEANTTNLTYTFTGLPAGSYTWAVRALPV